MIKVVFFASIRESLGVGCVEIEDTDIRSVADLLARLCERGDNWRAALRGDSVLVAVNQTMVAPGTPVAAGDEVAFFPPVTGG